MSGKNSKPMLIMALPTIKDMCEYCNPDARLIYTSWKRSGQNSLQLKIIEHIEKDHPEKYDLFMLGLSNLRKLGNLTKNPLLERKLNHWEMLR